MITLNQSALKFVFHIANFSVWIWISGNFAAASAYQMFEPRKHGTISYELQEARIQSLCP